MTKDILVVGSSNTDMVIQADRLPAGGETILGGRFFMNPGGKGANQAVAAARLGGRISFIAKTGNDIFGEQALELFRAEGIETRHLLSDPANPSGIALITVDKNGENCIVVASGANASLSETDLLDKKHAIEQAGLVLLQLEIPLDTVRFVVETAAAKGIPVILNPAPACPLPNSLLSRISLITPNEKEAEMLSGLPVTDMDSARRAAEKIKDLGVETVIITLGKNGALLFHKNRFTHIPGLPVLAVDSTAAGDVFNGALVVGLAEGKPLADATRFACAAAALSVTRMGAQSSAPRRDEVERFLQAQTIKTP